jgi:aminomethyltransferase
VVSPLERYFVDRGIAFVSIGEGVQAPRSFAHAITEHLTTRRAVGLFDFSFMALYEISGHNALAFVDRIQARAISHLEAGRLAYTLLMNDDATVFVDATVWRRADDCWWLFTGRRSDFAWLAQRAHAFDAAIRDRSGEQAVLALQGPQCGRALARLIGERVVRELRYFRFVETTLGTIPTSIGRLGFSGELGYEILVPAGDALAAWQQLLDAGQPFGVHECGFDAANSLRIESGYVLFGHEITGRETPAELGLGRLVERGGTIPREPARRLVGLDIASRPANATVSPLLPLAQATSECESPLFRRTIALGFVTSADAHPGTLMRLADGRAGRVARLPFYDPARRLPRATPL